jgi:hypothetical protein
MLYGLGGKAGYHPSAQKPMEDTGRALSADVLSFGGIIYGSFSGVRDGLIDRIESHSKKSGPLWRLITMSDFRLTLQVGEYFG